MKRIILSLLFVVVAYSPSWAQYFFDDFESYTVGQYVAPQSTKWTTWSAALGGSEGGSDDVYVANSKAYSGSKSLYFYSAYGGGPSDLVLDFGGVHNSGRFKYTARYFIPTGKNSYFNFQAGAGVAQQWAIEFYFNSGGTWNIYGGGNRSGTFPHNQWFELTIDANFDTDTWEVFVNGTSQGTFACSAAISYLDLYEASSSSEWWIDDVSFCVNKGCNPELELTNLQVNPTSICTHDVGDLSVTVKNNSTFAAQSMVLGVNVGSVTSFYPINLNALGSGQSTTINLTGVVVPAAAGSGIVVAAINLQGDVNASNDTAKTTITVLPSPTGTKITQGSPYQSPRMQSTGTLSDPDVVTAGDTLTYEVSPPVGQTNSGHGITWEITSVSFSTVNGTILSNANYSYTAPVGSNNAKIRFMPGTALLDSAVVYSFKVVDKSNSCDSVLMRYINVVPRPVSQFTHLDVCDQETMSFTNTSTILSGSMSFIWDFGDGSGSVLQNPTKAYATYGSYVVKLIATSNWGYVDTFDITVKVNQLPVADFAVTNACEGSNVMFTDQSFFPSGTPSFVWVFGDGSANGTGQTTGHLYSVPGTYLVDMTVTINGCSDSKSKYATQAPRAVPSFTSQVACNNTTAKFTNGSTLLFGTFGSTWRFGDGTTGSSFHASRKYAGFGNFNVTLITTTDLGCVDSVVKTITTIESPNADFTLSNACSEETITLNNLTNTPVGGANSYAWDFGNGLTSSAENPTTQFPSPGMYTVKLEVFNSNGCSDSKEQTIKIDTKPIADFLANDVCEGEVNEFENNTVNLPDGGTYFWDFGNTQTSISKDASITYASSGSYTVKLVVSTANGCFDTAIQVVKVNAIPNAGFVQAPGQKGDGTITFAANAGAGNTFFWFVGDGTKYYTSNVIHTYLSPGTYEAKLIVTSAEGCLNESRQMVSVTPSGLNAVETNSLLIYPNPNSGLFTIQVDEELIHPTLEIVNAQGQSVLLVPNVSSDNGRINVDLGNVAKGIYFARLSTMDHNYTQKIHIQ